jgi:phosphate transport system permease protein
LGAGQLLALLALTAVACYLIAYVRARHYIWGRAAKPTAQTLPAYYALHALLWCTLPALSVLVLWYFAQDALLVIQLQREMPLLFADADDGTKTLLLDSIYRVADNPDIKGLVDEGVAQAGERLLALRESSMYLSAVAFMVLLLAGSGWGVYLVQPHIKAKMHVERALRSVLLLCAALAVLSTIGIVATVLLQSVRFFDIIPIFDFLFGTEWSPQIALRPDQVASQGSFGVLPLIAGTLLIAAVAMLVAVPVGIMSAIYLSEYAGHKMRAISKPIVEILAGIPTVVYGVFAALTVAPALVRGGADVGLSVSPESGLAAGLVMGIMTIPFVSSLSDDVINAVPLSLREGGYGLGATRSEVIRHIVLPAALTGIAGGILLAVSRAIGETMIVVMAAGLAAKLTANPMESVTTVTVQIVSLLVGDQEFNDPKTLAAFALGLYLFGVTLLLNIWALWIVRRYREQYD